MMAPRAGTSRLRPGQKLLTAITAQPTVLLATTFLALTLIAAVAPQALTSEDPQLIVTSDRLLPPGSEHWFGTDHLGRDVLTRVIYGARLSVGATVIAVLIAMLVGTIIGLLAGYLGGVVDDVAMRLMDVLLSVPSLMLSFVVIALLGPGSVNVAIAVGIAGVAMFARIVRSEVLNIKHTAYVEAARGSGLGRVAVLFRHVLPNASGPLAAMIALHFGYCLLSIAALSFLGFGAPLPTPEWGSQISEGRSALVNAWWISTLPGLVLVFTVLATNRISTFINADAKGPL